MLTAVACVAATVLAGCTGSAERAGAPASRTAALVTDCRLGANRDGPLGRCHRHLRSRVGRHRVADGIG